VQKLILFRSECDVKRALKHATAVVSRRHFVDLKDRAAACVSTLQGHRGGVTSVAFHPSCPYLATGSSDHTAKLWLLNGNDATCVSTLEGHNNWVYSVAFHPSAPYLATGSGNKSAKLWR
jgi:WD40 repeat protein